MSNELSPKQALVLWNLLITGDEPMMSKVKPELSPKQRQPLIEAGLISLERRGRATHIVLEDKAWDWAVKNFDTKISRCYDATSVLQALLAKLGHYLDIHQVALADVLTATDMPKTTTDTVSKDANPAVISKLSVKDLPSKIRQAYFNLPDGEAGFRVRLHQLREQLSGFSKSQMDQVLLDMQAKGAVALLIAEDPQELTAADEAAAIDMGGGDKRYFAHIEN
ncbi:MAG: hypothetical protein ACFB0E_18830 [Leptolyngbyaceae cyanobacterium]